MDIATFLSESLQEIMTGVMAAQDFAKRDGRGAKVNPRGRTVLKQDQNGQKEPHDLHSKLPLKNVEFDIAVTACDSHEKSGGAGIQVYALRLGGETGTSSENATVSRIKFSIPMILPDPNLAEEESCESLSAQS